MTVFNALCSPGLEALLSREIRRLGPRVVRSEPGRVVFEATGDQLALCLLGLRTADRVLWQVARSEALRLPQLFDWVQALPWEHWLPPNALPRVQKVRLAPTCEVRQVPLQAAIHKGVLVGLGRSRVPRGASGPPQDLVLRVYGQENRYEICVDLTPVPLSQRGYRTEGGEAPLRETVAAAVVILSGPNRRSTFWDPLCGGGTILAEAALWALDRAPNRDRRFDLPPGLGVGEEVFRRAREYWQGLEKERWEGELLGSDRDPAAIDRARRNLARLNLPPAVQGRIRLEVRSLQESRGPEGAWLLTNPPWGERLETRAEAASLLRNLGGVFRRDRLAALSVLTSLDDSVRTLAVPRVRRHFLKYGGLSVQLLVAKPERSC